MRGAFRECVTPSGHFRHVASVRDRSRALGSAARAPSFAAHAGAPSTARGRSRRARDASSHRRRGPHHTRRRYTPLGHTRLTAAAAAAVATAAAAAAAAARRHHLASNTLCASLRSGARIGRRCACVRHAMQLIARACVGVSPSVITFLHARARFEHASARLGNESTRCHATSVVKRNPASFGNRSCLFDRASARRPGARGGEKECYA